MTAPSHPADIAHDPFAPARREDGVLVADFAGETIPMILGHRAVRSAARDWQSFSSDAPGRVPIPEETAVRSVRQLPIETDPRRIPFAVEEFVRVTSPLTHIGRVCPHGAEVSGHRVAPGARVSLCWASANFDETVFEAPQEVRLDRAPNPHLGFGSGHHTCLGAAHARTLLRSLLRQLGARTRAITVLGVEPVEERYGDRVRTAGYRSLTVRIEGTSPS